jgi:hypothetical protein
MTESYEDRIYKHYKKRFEEYKGTLNRRLDQSDLVGEMIAFDLVNEFMGEMYNRWLDESKYEDKIL